jgi:multidrug efflux pump subunit AcrB
VPVHELNIPAALPVGAGAETRFKVDEMRLTRSSLANPAAVAVIAAAVVLLGILSLFNMPAQLFPNIQKPVLTVINFWPGASPAEIESEITARVEEVLNGTPGMTSMEAWSLSSFGFMQLEFAIETDMTMATVDVISRLNRLQPLPANAEKPQVSLGEFGDASDTLIEYYVQQIPGTEDQMSDNRQWLRDVIVPEIQSLPGVSRIDFNDGTNGTGNQLQIIFDPFRAAELGIDISRVPGRIGRSTDVSSGFLSVGRMQYTLRLEGRYDPDELADLILEWRDGLPITLGDIATIEIGPGRASGFIYQNGGKSFAFNIFKTNDANVLESLEAVKTRMDELNSGEFRERGLKAEYAFDPGVYIKRSMRLLGGNLFIGVLLAVGVLWAFLRQWRATFLIALAIPISLLSTFVVLGIAGRSLNIISLAGLAFATGMVLDAAIVVLENIVRLRERGESPKEASDTGTEQVHGALLASTATTVAIFIPIMFLEDAEGQMFADLAMTIAIGVSVSLLVAITVLPTAARFWMRQIPEPLVGETIWDRMADKLMEVTNSLQKRMAWIFGLIATSISLTILLWPQSNYLPPINRDNVDAIMSFPPGISIEAADEEIAQVIDARLQPYMTGDKEPHIRNYAMFTFGGGTNGWLSVTPDEDADLNQVQAVVQSEIIANLPGVFGFAFRRPLFGGFGSANSVELQILTSDLEAGRLATLQAFGMVMSMISGATAQGLPDPSAQAMELRFRPNDRRLAEVGWNRRDLTMVLLELGEGAWLGEYYNGQTRLDIYLKTERFSTPEEMGNLPVQTPLGGRVPLNELADISVELGPTIIRHFDRTRGYGLTVNPPEGMSLEGLIDKLHADIVPAIMASLPPGSEVRFAGSAEDLERATGTLAYNFLIAFVMLIFIMSALFKSIKAALLVVISIPLAGVGGVLAINMMNLVRFQPLDLLGMIGFIILLGLVVNNAILLVAQTQIAENRGMTRVNAVRQALRLRLRPIFMSTLTSLFGMLPLLVFPGSGSEVYRGMAAAIVGGMAVSTLFTLVLLPSLLQLTGGAKIASKPAPERDQSALAE